MHHTVVKNRHKGLYIRLNTEIDFDRDFMTCFQVSKRSVFSYLFLGLLKLQQILYLYHKTFFFHYIIFFCLYSRKMKSYSTSHELCNIMSLWGFQWAFQKAMIYHEFTCNTGFSSIFLFCFLYFGGWGVDDSKFISTNNFDSVKKISLNQLSLNFKSAQFIQKHLTCQNNISDAQRSFICPDNVNISCHVISFTKMWHVSNVPIYNNSIQW